MGKKNIGGAVLDDLKALPKKILKPYYKNGKVFNTINFAKSMHYNPFAYIHTEQDVLKFVNTLIANTKGEGAQSGEDFWVKAERLLFTAYVALDMSIPTAIMKLLLRKLRYDWFQHFKIQSD